MMGPSDKYPLAVDPSGEKNRKEYVEKLKKKGRRITSKQPVVRAKTFKMKDQVARHLRLTPAELGKIQSGYVVRKMMSKAFFSRLANQK